MTISQKYFKGKPKWVKSAALDSDGELWFYGCDKSELESRGLSYEVPYPEVKSKFSGIILNIDWIESATNRIY